MVKLDQIRAVGKTAQKGGVYIGKRKHFFCDRI